MSSVSVKRGKDKTGARRHVVRSPYLAQFVGILVDCADEIGVPGCERCPVMAECREFADNIGWLNDSSYNRKITEFQTIKNKRDRLIAQDAAATGRC